MAFFRKTESQRLAPPKVETPPPAEPPSPRPKRRGLAIKTFVLGLLPSEKLAHVPDGRLGEGLLAALPQGAHVTRVGGEGAHQFEVELTGDEDMIDALQSLLEQGLMNGEVKLALHHCAVSCKAEGVNSPVALSAEALERGGARLMVRTTSQDVQVQYPPAEIHRRWQQDEDYNEAWARWRARRTQAAAGRWSGGWAEAGPDEAPPWIKLGWTAPGEYAPEFDDGVLLRFAFQGAETAIMRFNLRVLLNTVTGEAAVYRSLPITLESLPRDLQERMNREPERFAPLREPGQFGQNYDLVRALYEEAGGEYFHLENPHAPAPAPEPAPERRPAAPPPRPSGAAPRPVRSVIPPKPTPWRPATARPAAPAAVAASGDGAPAASGDGGEPPPG